MAMRRRCDGMARRDFLHVGMLSAFGLSLAGSLRLRAAQPAKERATSCILIWLDGGPSHIDTFDPKPDAPVEVRGDFKAIGTAVDGVRICEHLPRTAKAMGEVALLRSLTHELGNHDTGSHYMLTGHRQTPAVEYPSLGSVVARERGDDGAVMPPYVAAPHGVRAAGAGYLPGAYSPFAIGGDVSRAGYRVKDLEAPEGLSLRRQERRKSMLEALDDFSREVEQGPATAGRDAFYEQAYRLMTSREAKGAFDLSKEPDAVRERYGRGRVGASCLLARRLVEAGTRFVTVVDDGWDTHNQIFKALPDAQFPGSGKLPALDRAYAALLGDLKERGLLGRTLVVLMGEFGRTPKLNSLGGRDHWPRAGSALLAGGGVRGGQVLGATDGHGEAPIDAPVSPGDVAFSMLTLLGIDPTRETAGPGGRPVRIIERGEMIGGLT